jgi:acyl-CoA reductase-like NAD-dependent aldehyde dehydrogenase
VDPSTGELLGQVPALPPEAVDNAVQAARRAQPQWARAKVSRRRAVARSILATLVQGQDELCRLAAHDSGATMVEIAVGQLLPTCEAIRHACARHTLTDAHGVVGVVASPTMPLLSAVAPTVRALVEGNAVALKLAEATSWSGLAFAELIRDRLKEHRASGELLQVLTGYDDVTEALCTAVDRVVRTDGEVSPTSRVVPSIADDDYGTVEAAIRAAYGNSLRRRARAIIDLVKEVARG